MPRIRINGPTGVVGEDGADWLGGTEHECSVHFAIHLTARGLGHVIDAPRAATTDIQHGDPVVESRDPGGLDSSSASPIAKPAKKARG